MSAAKTPIFLIGATGYVGGTVLHRLLTHLSADTFEITVLVRSEEKAKKLESFGVKPVVGSTKDVVLLEGLVEQAHVVFSCADADDLPAMEAILSGLRKRHAKLGDLPILIHTSGTGELTIGQETKGMYATDTIYDDSNVEQIESLPPDAFHRNVDLAVVQADKEGYVKTYIILPSTIYGIASTPLVDAGIQNPYSIQIPALIKASLGRGHPGMVGKGAALWGSVNIDEVADLFIILFDAIVSNPESVGHGREGYYFGSSDEHAWYQISKAIGKAMVELGLSKSDEPTAFSDEELVKYFGSLWMGNYSGTNSRARANHSKAIGWKPKKGTEDLVASIKAEVEAILKQQKN
ncbi:hypothetical protein PHLCEN_2v1386 [Hermanssonia centrifuga]|uniref:NmrA-like domain-containing protein n=1 Tax=Hermanssonia centrifuga TaxID=98765 RepID=A0A2R6S3C5_9APHY|nr:hypothetical protein PHLCEN_2v1386 [Hermanssonia centrifuga]